MFSTFAQQQSASTWSIGLTKNTLELHTVHLLCWSLADLKLWRLQLGISTIHAVCRRLSSLVEIVADADRNVLLRFGDGTEGRLAVRA